MDAVAGLEPEMKAEAIHSRHSSLVRILVTVKPGDEPKCVGMIGVHVLDDSRRGVRQWIRPAVSIIFRRDPSHYAETADEIHSRNFEAVVREIGVILPEFRILIVRQVEIAYLFRGRLVRFSQQGEPGGAERIARNVRLRNEQAGAPILPQVLGVHRHAADKENGAALFVRRKRHHRTEGEPGKSLGMCRKAADSAE